MEESEDLPVRVVVTDDLERSRATVLVRLLLAIPHLVVVALWGAAAGVVAIVLWLALLVEGRAPRTLQGFVATYLRYAAQVSAYVHLAAGPFPRFGGAAGYPVDVEIDVQRRQSRGRVAARALLALPALLLAGTLGGTVASSGLTAGATGGGVAAAAAFLAWFACLARGRMPHGLRDAVAYCIAYTTHAAAYLLLVTERYPDSNPERVLPLASLPPHPVRLELRDRVERSRLTVFFRYLLALPHLLWLGLWSVLAALAVIPAWLAALATGRVPSPLHRFLAAWVRYATHVLAFLLVVGGPFPGFVGAAGSYPVDLAIAPPERQRRAVTLFRLLLAVPAVLVSGAYAVVLYAVALLGWWASLVTGRMPEGIRTLGAVALRYTGQVNAYLFLLTDRYPFASPALRDRPRDVQLELFEPPPALAEVEPA